jgi:hypothetical protein
LKRPYWNASVPRLPGTQWRLKILSYQLISVWDKNKGPALYENKISETAIAIIFAARKQILFTGI